MKGLARFTKNRLCVVWLIITACALCDLFQTVVNGNRHKKECPFSHIECDVTGDSIFWHTNKQDDFYCKDAKAHEPEKL